MSPGLILGAFLALSALELAWDVGLTALNMRHTARRSREVPAFFRTLWERRRAEPPEETYRRSVAYTLARSRLSIAAQLVSTSTTIALVTSGALGALERLTASVIPLPGLAGLGFVFAVALAMQLVTLPVGLYGQFAVEQRFGFNTMTLGLWLLDRLKGLAVSVLLLAPLALALFALMERAGDAWWAYASAVVILFQVGLSVLYPALIAPLFNRFAPLADGPLKERVMELCARLGFRVRGVSVMDASRRSRHSNAYFTGLGRSKRIVLYDTMLRRAAEQEVLAVLAHEIGHEKLGHVKKGLILSSAATVVGLWILSLLAGWEPFFRAFGLGAPSSPGALVLFALCSGPFTFAFQPIVSLVSRRHEYAADRFAREAMGSGEPLVQALLDLHTDNLSNLDPHPLYSFVHYSHPTLAERVRALRS